MTALLDAGREDTGPSRPRHRRRRRTRLIVRGLCALAALVALTSTAAPTGIVVADRLWCAAFAAAVTYVASRASRASLVWMTGLTAVAAVGGWALAPAVVALGCVFVANESARRRRRIARAAAGGLAAIALLNLPGIAFHGAETLVAIAAVLPLLPSSDRRSPPAVRRRARRVVAWGAGALVLVGVVTAVAAAMAAPSLVKGGDGAQAGLNAAGQGAQAGSAQSFTTAEAEFSRASTLLDGPWMLPARVVPIVSQHVRAMSTVARSGHELSEAAGAAATAAPYKELTTESGRVDLDQVRRMQEPVRVASEALAAAEDDMNEARSPWLLGPVATALDDVVDKVAEARPEVSLAADGLQVAPGLLGGDGDRRYLVLFTTPAETRNLGGFTGAYAVLEARDGDVDLATSGPVADLIVPPGVREITGHDEFLERYDRYRPERLFQNVTASPDMPTVAEVAASLYEQSTAQPVDGVLVVDPFALEAFLQLTGPVDVEGIDMPISAENVVEFLLRDQYVAFDTNTDRQDKLQDIGRATFDALTDRSLPGPARLGDVLGPAVAGKHLMFVPFDPAAQAFMGRLGTLGSFARPERSDFLSVRMANLRANKIDVFVHRDVSYDLAYDPATGLVEGTVRVRVRNEAPASGLPEYVIGAAGSVVPQGTARMLTAVYTPLDAIGATLDGEPIGLEPQREAGANVFTAPVTVPSASEVVLEVQLRGVVEGMGTTYRLLASSQPLANADQLAVTVSGAEGATVTGGQGVDVAGGVARAEGEWTIDQRLRVRFG